MLEKVNVPVKSPEVVPVKESKISEIPVKQKNEFKSDFKDASAQLKKDLGIDKIEKPLQKKEDPKPEEGKEKKEEEPKKPSKESELEKQVSELTKKYEKLQEEFQKRIDQTTAKFKEAEEKYKAEKGKNLPEGEEFSEQDLAEQQREVIKKLKEIGRKRTEALISGDEASYDQLSEMEESLRWKVYSFENEAKSLRERVTQREHEGKIKANTEGWMKSFFEGFTEFGLIKDGKVDEASPIFKETIKILQENADKPKYALHLQKINPKYDNDSGPYHAILKAAMTVSKQSGHKEDSDKSQKLKQENDKLKSLTQPLSEDRSFGGLQDSQEMAVSSVEKKRLAAIDRKSTKEDVDEYVQHKLREINKKMGIR